MRRQRIAPVPTRRNSEPVQYAVIVGILCFFFVTTVEAVPPPVIKAKSAIVVDAETGQVLYELRADERRPMASTTKMMTAILLIERGKLDDLVVATENAVRTRYANLNMTPGEAIPLRDMLYAILLRSSNDGSVAAAEYLCGSEQQFVQLMNEKAKEMGLTNTHFANAHGLDHPEHYSSARDLTTLARYCIRNPLFNEIVRTREVRIQRSVNQQDVLVRTKARCLKYLPGADGIKTGYTAKAGRCFVGSVTRNGWRLISVVLGSSDADSDTRALIEWAYKHYVRIQLAEQGEVVATQELKGAKPKQVPLAAATSLSVVVPRRFQAKVRTALHLDQMKPPIRQGQSVGELRAVMDGRMLAQVPVVTTVEVVGASRVSLALWMVLLAALWVTNRLVRQGRLNGYYRRGVAQRPWTSGWRR